MIDNTIEVMKKQLSLEMESANKRLTTNNLDSIYKLTTSIHNLECMRDGKENKDSVIIPQKQENPPEETMKKYSNGKYDKNIDSLYEAYIAAKKLYQEKGDSVHKQKLVDSVSRLMAEVYDMLHEMIVDSHTMQERHEIQRQINKLSIM